VLTLDAIRERVRPVAEKYNVVTLELFGSYADGVANETSDVDFFTQFAVAIPSIFKVMGFREELSRSLGIPVDVVTLPLVNPDKLRIFRTVKIL